MRTLSSVKLEATTPTYQITRRVQVATPETCPLPDCSETCDCTWMTVSFLGMCHDTIRPSQTCHLCSLAAGLRQEE